MSFFWCLEVRTSLFKRHSRFLVAADLLHQLLVSAGLGPKSLGQVLDVPELPLPQAVLTGVLVSVVSRLRGCFACKHVRASGDSLPPPPPPRLLTGRIVVKRTRVLITSMPCTAVIEPGVVYLMSSSEDKSRQALRTAITQRVLKGHNVQV